MKIRHWFLLVCAAVVMVGAQDASAAKRRTPVSDGEYRVYYASGALQRVENYKFEQKHGTFTDYFDTGAVKAVVNYEKDMRHGGSKTYWSSGVLKTEGTYLNNELQGLFTAYSKDGRPEIEQNYERGVLNGEARMFYASGAVLKQMNYKHAVLDGLAIEYYENGQMKGQDIYKDGVLVARRNLDKVDKLLGATDTGTTDDKDKKETKPAVKSGMDEKAKPADAAKAVSTSSTVKPAENKTADDNITGSMTVVK